jgi:hypothetical protein
VAVNATNKGQNEWEKHLVAGCIAHRHPVGQVEDKTKYFRPLPPRMADSETPETQVSVLQLEAKLKEASLLKVQWAARDTLSEQT